jgi:hypothetical protein
VNRPIVKTALAACASLVATGAHCAEPTAKAVDAAARAETRAAGAAYTQITDAPADSETPKPTSAQIATDENGAHIVMRLGKTWSKPIPSHAGAALAFDSLSLALSAPVSGENKDDKTATLDRLAGGTSLEASFSRMVVTRPQADSRQILAVCDAVREEQDLHATALKARAAQEGARGDERAVAVTGIEVEKAQAIATEAEEKLKGNGCDSDFLALYAPQRLDQHERALWGERPSARLYGASLKTSRDVFDYVDPATAAKLSAEKSGWSLKAFYALRPFDKPWLLLVTAEHQDGYEARDEAITCPPGGVTADCVNGPAGAPEHKISDQISLEYRRDFGELSAALAVTYDARDNLFAAELPIYLVRGDDGAFNGGFKLNWRSDNGDVLASVFVGQSFSLGMP